MIVMIQISGKSFFQSGLEERVWEGKTPNILPYHLCSWTIANDMDGGLFRNYNIWIINHMSPILL